MTHTKHARFVAFTADEAARLRRDPDALAQLLGENREEAGLGVYWHGVQYLLAGRAKGVRGPFAWFTSGGAKLGRTTGGPVRYLSPKQVSELAKALADETPDDLGDGIFDEAAMDAAGVYPGTWVRSGKDYDALGTMRELYAYVQEFLMKQSSAGKGVLVVLSLEPAPDLEETEEEQKEPVAAKPEPGVPAEDLILAGAEGRRYVRAPSSTKAPTPPVAQALDTTLAGLGYRPLGDLVILPLLADGIVRIYRSADETVTVAAIIGSGKVASTTFFSPLANNALVVASDALVLDKTKRKLFSTTKSAGTPAQLDAALRERRSTLEKKHGAPVPSPATLESACAIWEDWCLKRAGTW